MSGSPRARGSPREIPDPPSGLDQQGGKVTRRPGQGSGDHSPAISWIAQLAHGRNEYGDQREPEPGPLTSAREREAPPHALPFQDQTPAGRRCSSCSRRAPAIPNSFVGSARAAGTSRRKRGSAPVTPLAPVPACDDADRLHQVGEHPADGLTELLHETLSVIADSMSISTARGASRHGTRMQISTTGAGRLRALTGCRSRVHGGTEAAQPAWSRRLEQGPSGRGEPRRSRLRTGGGDQAGARQSWADELVATAQAVDGQRTAAVRGRLTTAGGHGPQDGQIPVTQRDGNRRGPGRCLSSIPPSARPGPGRARPACHRGCRIRVEIVGPALVCISPPRSCRRAAVLELGRTQVGAAGPAPRWFPAEMSGHGYGVPRSPMTVVSGSIPPARSARSSRSVGLPAPGPSGRPAPPGRPDRPTGARTVSCAAVHYAAPDGDGAPDADFAAVRCCRSRTPCGGSTGCSTGRQPAGGLASHRRTDAHRRWERTGGEQPRRHLHLRLARHRPDLRRLTVAVGCEGDSEALSRIPGHRSGELGGAPRRGRTRATPPRPCCTGGTDGVIPILRPRSGRRPIDCCHVTGCSSRPGE